VIDIRSLRSSFGPAPRLAVMFVLTANAGARAQQPEPAAPTESERRDDTAGKSTTEMTKFVDCPGARVV